MYTKPHTISILHSCQYYMILHITCTVFPWNKFSYSLAVVECVCHYIGDPELVKFMKKDGG